MKLLREALIPILTLWAVFIGMPLAARDASQSREYAFMHLTSTQSGLSFNNVIAISQDSNGFVWVGTSDGLNRFDGVSFKVYRKEDLGLQTAFIVSLCPDAEGGMWVGTDSGASHYNCSTDRFEPLLAATADGVSIQNKVTFIRTDSEGTVWMAVNGQGLFSYSPQGGTLDNFFMCDGESPLPADIDCFSIDNNGDFWLSLYFCGLYHAGKELKEAVPVEGFPLLEGDNIVDMSRNQARGTLFLASVNNGLCEVDLRNGQARTLIPNDSGFVPVKMFEEEGRCIWMATTRGLWRYDLLSRQISHFTSDPGDDFSLGDNRVSAVFVDRSSGLWVGTVAGGVDYNGAFQNHFHRFTSVEGLSLQKCMARSMAESSDGDVWITTETKGLLHLDAQTNALSRYRKSGSLPEELFGICCDGADLWLGSFQGIIRLNITTGRTKLYSRLGENAQLRDNKIYAITRLSDGRILAGTTLGLLVYDRVSDSFSPAPGLEGVFVTGILQDSRGRLWIASYAGGIFQYDIDGGSVLRQWSFSPDNPGGIPSNKINSLMEDTSGRLWASSYYSGFFRYDEQEDTFTVFNTATNPSVVSDLNYAVVEDSRSRLWVSSNKGVMALDMQEDGGVVTYTSRDGLLDDEFNFYSGIRLQDGSLLFGSINGLVRFNPQDLDVPLSPARIILTDFRIGGQVVTPLEEGSPLSRNIDQTTCVVLPSKSNSIGVRVTIPQLASPAHGGISYRLEGYDGEWRELSWTGRPRIIFWQNLPAGRYRLVINGATDSHSPIDIVIKRHPLASWPALAIYFLLFVAAVAGLTWYFSERQTRRAERELFTDKFTFFTNIIHEIKTPLTLIKTPLQNIMARKSVMDEDLGEDLSLISVNADYMDKLVKEMLDFVRIEQNGYQFRYSRIDLVDKIRLIITSFEQAARSKNIFLEFASPCAEIIVNADDSGLTKVINNLIHNAVKYAETFIRITASLEGDTAVVAISNDGPLIPKSRRKEIFKPFVQFSGDTSPYSQSFGIGLSLARTIAQRHGGSLELDDCPETRFILRLPVNAGATAGERAATEGTMPEIEEEGRPLVLVVEDNADLLSYLKRKLSGAEYRVMTASSAEVALSVIGQNDIDLLISDVALGGMSGIELCRRISTDFENSHIVVIMLSAISSVSTKLEAMESGASLYIEKPFDLEYLLSSMKILLEKRAAMRESYINDVRPDVHSFCLPGSDEAFLNNLDSVIMQNLADSQFSNDQLADALNLSRSTLIRKVKGLLGTTPNDYIRLKRLSVAASLLENNTTRISEVCYSVGFNTPSYFAKCFRARYGVLPNDYMKEHTTSNK